MFSKTTRLEIMLEAMPDAFAEMDQKPAIRLVNRQTEWLFGYDYDDVDISLPRTDAGDALLDHRGA